MLEVVQASQEVDVLLRVCLLEVCHVDDIARWIVFAILAIVPEITIVGLLVGLGILSSFLHLLDVLCPTLLVCLGVLQQVLHEVESLRQILVQSVEADLQGVVLQAIPHTSAQSAICCSL